MSNAASGWEMLVQERYDDAERLLARHRLDRKRANRMLNTEVAAAAILLCLGRLEEAIALCDYMIKEKERCTWQHMLAGIAQWMSGNQENAVKCWQRGLMIRAAVFYSGADCALFLLWAEARTSGRLDASSARAHLAHPEIASRCSASFIGVLVEYLLDRMDEQSVRERAYNSKWAHFVATRLAQLDFYVAAKKFARDDHQGFKRHMMSCCRAKGVKDFFPELALARFEMGLLPF